VEGGSANDYDYCAGDPINCNDLDGLRSKKQNAEWLASVGWYCLKTRAAFKCDAAKSYGESAVRVANTLFTPGTAQWDAFKHIYWHALMVADGFGFRWTEGFGKAYEGYSNNKDGPGDIMNNRSGAIIGQRYKDGYQGDLARDVEDFVRSGRANTTTNCARCTG